MSDSQHNVLEMMRRSRVTVALSCHRFLLELERRKHGESLDVVLEEHGMDGRPFNYEEWQKQIDISTSDSVCQKQLIGFACCESHEILGSTSAGRV